MKKLLAIMLAASMAAGYGAAQAAAAEGTPSDSIMAQIQANKAANKEKAANNAPAQNQAQTAKKDETKKSDAAKAIEQISKEEAAKAAKENSKSENNKGTAPAAGQKTTAAAEPAKKPAPVKTVQIPSAQEQKKTEPVKTVQVQQKQEQKKAEPVKTVQIQPAQEQKKAEPVKTVQIQQTQEQKKTEPVKQETKPAAQTTAVAAPNASEVPAGRPLKPTPLATGAQETRESFFVTVDWLKTHRASVILIDARPESLYVGGHIPGAVNAPWTYFANMNAKQGTEKWGVLWPAATMGKRLGALGINGKKTVVAYADAGGWGQGGYVVWILRQAGIKNAKVLQGGITAWKADGGQTTKAKQGNKAVAFSISKYTSPYTVTTEWINDNLGKPGLAIIDVRTEPEYLGKIRPFQEKRAGHLPGAVNIPRESFINSDGTFKTPDDIASMLASAGITPENEIVVYDTAGVRGAFVTMMLRYANFLKSANYDEGFQAWAGNAELPLVKP